MTAGGDVPNSSRFKNNALPGRRVGGSKLDPKREKREINRRDTEKDQNVTAVSSCKKKTA